MLLLEASNSMLQRIRSAFLAQTPFKSVLSQKFGTQQPKSQRCPNWPWRRTPITNPSRMLQRRSKGRRRRLLLPYFVPKKQLRPLSENRVFLRELCRKKSRSTRLHQTRLPLIRPLQTRLPQTKHRVRRYFPGLRHRELMASWKPLMVSFHHRLGSKWKQLCRRKALMRSSYYNRRARCSLNSHPQLLSLAAVALPTAKGAWAPKSSAWPSDLATHCSFRRMVWLRTWTLRSSRGAEPTTTTRWQRPR